MFDFIRKAALAGIGALTLTEERARKLVGELVEQGRMSAEEGENLIKEMLARAESSKTEWEGRLRQMVQEGFRKMDLVPRKDLDAACEKIRSLEKRIGDLEKKEAVFGEDLPLT